MLFSKMALVLHKNIFNNMMFSNEYYVLFFMALLCRLDFCITFLPPFVS
jgi:hypothetical protein